MNEQLCISWDGKETIPPNISLYNLGENYITDPYLKFDKKYSYLKLSPLYRNTNLLYIKKISFDICGDHFRPGVFNFQTSENELNWSDNVLFVSGSILDNWIHSENPNAEIAKKINNIISKQVIEFETPNNLRYLRFIITTYSGGKVRLGNIKLYCLTDN